MNAPSYTLKDIALLLSPAGDAETVEKLARQVRHWTNLDLLQPLGKKHTGTGISRRYDHHQVLKALILSELSRYRVPVTVLDEAFATMMDHFATTPDWSEATTGERPVFLMFGFSDDFVTMQLFTEATRHPLLAPKSPGAFGSSEIVSAITINLSALFKRLRR
jgi:hypothetical protein